MSRNRTHYTSGFGDLDANLAALQTKVATKAGQVAVRKGAVLMARDVRAAARRDEGELKRNIRARKGKSKDRNSITYIVSVGKAFYAAFIEFGTRKMAAKPFFKPAMDAVAKQSFNEIVTELRAAVQRIGRGGRP